MTIKIHSDILELPNEPVPLGSMFYIERPPVEEQIYQEVTKPGCIIRIKAPRKMGKSSLLLRVIDFVKHQEYRTIYLDFQLADRETFKSLDKFLRWFCANITHKLKLKERLQEYWDEELGSKVNCSIYFQDYVLPCIESPLVLVLNEVDLIFEYPKIAQDFLGLLRAWHEAGKHQEIWRQLKLVICHSTEIYINLNINQSPFNIGLSIELPEFTIQQIQSLIPHYQLRCKIEIPQIVLMQKMLGGHPYLVRLALYELAKNPKITLEELLESSPSITGIYSTHLRSLLVTLQNNPALGIALKQVVNSSDSVEINHILAYKLESMGLVKINGGLCKVSCELYRRYFMSQNLEELNLQDKLVQLKKENIELKQLAITDELTQVANRRYFDIHLEQLWQKLALEMAPLSMILCEIDYLKLYSNTNGKQAEHSCLQQIARALEAKISSSSGTSDFYSKLIARYDYEQFAILLPKMNSLVSSKLAESIRHAVIKLGISHNSAYDGFPARVVTVSLGLACTIPNAHASTNMFIDATVEALNNSKRNNRNRTYVSSTLNH
jgi:diguanylate cyclase (GGDEF)-like protein